ncbi:MAG: YkgJ family cysteine cluster protein [Desulfobacula sp.]|jgi:Fe-S-cluster containining protein
MDKSHITHLLLNYHNLVKKVDLHIDHITTAYPDEIVCKKGCDVCCRFLTLFPVEAVALSAAFTGLSEDIKAKIVLKIKNEANFCPLLIDRECVLYPARPIICRTHGYPIYMTKKGESFVDFCPDNFKNVTSFPKEMLLDIEQLNTMLTAINQHFIKSIETDPPLLDRISVSDAIFLLCS